jgi:hypothetical protein
MLRENFGVRTRIHQQKIQTKRNSTAAADEKKNQMKNFSDQENIQKTFRYKHLKYTQ